MRPDIVKALLFLAAAAVILAVLWAWSSEAEAEGWFNEPPYVFLGLYVNEEHTYCFESEEFGHLGFGQNFYQNGRHELTWQFQHNSCAFEESDRNNTNAVGIEYKLYLGSP